MARQRRAKGSGSTYQRKSDGRWVAQYWPAQGGKAQYRYARQTDNTQRAANRFLAAMAAADSRGELGSDPKTLAADFLTWWLDTVVKPLREPSTYRGYESHVRLYLAPAWKKKRLAKLDDGDWEALQKDLLSRGLSPNTVLRVRATAHRALEYARKKRLISRNIVEYADSPTAVKYISKPLTPPEVGRFLAFVEGHRWEAVWYVAYCQGMRPGEIAGLGLEDLDFTGMDPETHEGALIHVRHGLSRVGGVWRRKVTKTMSSVRTLELAPVAVPKLLAYLDDQLQRAEMREDFYNELGLVFTTGTGRPIDPSNLVHEFQELLEAAGLPRQRMQDTRHSAISFLFSLGYSEFQVQRIAGHSSHSMTTNVYGHLMPATRDGASRDISELVRVHVEQGRAELAKERQAVK